ncbi:unnamed protein product [Echinostoma caproni]|uniref:Uncharacterized protein n=1 Tax=Echinostoma caproni TaxID=27848 RepID=A0A3P8DDW9_9TREM|nr:unnamed protein product [Echinostoma caproni]
MAEPAATAGRVKPPDRQASSQQDDRNRSPAESDQQTEADDDIIVSPLKVKPIPVPVERLDDDADSTVEVRYST